MCALLAAAKPTEPNLIEKVKNGIEHAAGAGPPTFPPSASAPASIVTVKNVEKTRDAVSPFLNVERKK